MTGIDDHSRFIVCAGLMVRANSRSFCSHFAESLRTYGVPQGLLTDIQTEWRPSEPAPARPVVRKSGSRILVCRSAMTLFEVRPGGAYAG